MFFGVGEDEAVVTAEIWIERWRSRRSDRPVPDPQAAMLFVAGVAVLFFWAGSQLQLWLGERGLLAAEWLLLFVPSVLVVSLYGFDPVRTLSLRKPSGLGVLGSVLLIMGAVPLVWFIGWIQTFIFPVPWELLEGLEDLVTADTMGRLVWLLLLLAVTPAVCEEILFRGMLLGGTRTLQPWRMIVLNGVVFGAFHLSFETAIRFVPTATLGMVIAWAVWRTGSIWAGALMHFLNNGAIVALASAPAAQKLFATPDAPPPWWLVPVGAVLFALGARILLRHQTPVGVDAYTLIEES
ncbi:MAG: type II CAAX endopeptidase family protein [Longimicrobiales bacterium]|nr:type II CAAX endopeptidase family protein [Longimicrobiales bacterium]